MKRKWEAEEILTQNFDKLECECAPPTHIKYGTKNAIYWSAQIKFFTKKEHQSEIIEL